MNVIYAKGSEGRQFDKIYNEGTKAAMAKGWIRKMSSLNGRLVRLEDIDEPIDIYHCHSAHSVMGIRKARELGAVTILQRDSSHVLDMIEWCEEGNNIWRKIHPQCFDDLRARTDVDYQLEEYREADYILLASKLEETSFINRGIPTNKLKRIPFTVDSDKFRPLNKKHDFSVCLGGNMCVRKGYPEAKEACNKMNIPLNVIHGIPYESEQMVSTLNEYDVCLAPTREDGYPCQVLESMSCGLVPIVSNRNGVQDLINKKNGFIIDIKGDHIKAIQEIVEILKYLRDNPKIRKEMGMKARKAVSERTWDDYGNDVAEFYKKII